MTQDRAARTVADETLGDQDRWAKCRRCLRYAPQNILLVLVGPVVDRVVDEIQNIVQCAAAAVLP